MTPLADRQKQVEPDFLRACRSLPVERTPVWFMRQAGRYMPEYRAIRERYGFLEMCKTPDLVVEISLQPVHALGVDAAIVFSDILIPLEAMGLEVEYVPGPRIGNLVRSRTDIEKLRPLESDACAPVYRAIQGLRTELSREVPVIGFCGGPWTLANYAVEAGGGREFTRFKRLLYEDPQAGANLLHKLAEAASLHLHQQVEAGAQAVQIFDTWAGLLDADDYVRWALPPVQTLVQSLRSSLGDKTVPIIYFARDPGGLLPHCKETGADVVSLDWRVPLDTARHVLGREIALQGNLDPVALFAPWDELARRTDGILAKAQGQPGHIFNLGHGVLPETPVENVRRLVQYVHQGTARPLA